MVSIRKKVELDFTSLHFFDNYVISTVKKDVLLDKERVETLRKLCYEFYGLRKFAYIANRKNDYNVNPIIYLNLLKRNTLVGIAVVSGNIARLKTANFEKQFSPVPFDLFQNLEEAKAWGLRMVDQQ